MPLWGVQKHHRSRPTSVALQHRFVPPPWPVAPDKSNDIILYKSWMLSCTQPILVSNSYVRSSMPKILLTQNAPLKDHHHIKLSMSCIVVHVEVALSNSWMNNVAVERPSLPTPNSQLQAGILFRATSRESRLWLIWRRPGHSRQLTSMPLEVFNNSHRMLQVCSAEMLKSVHHNYFPSVFLGAIGRAASAMIMNMNCRTSAFGSSGAGTPPNKAQS